MYGDACDSLFRLEQAKSTQKNSYFMILPRLSR